MLFKDSANERHENLFSEGRVHPILFKDTEYGLDDPAYNPKDNLEETNNDKASKNDYNETY